MIFGFEPVNRKEGWKGPPAWPFIGISLALMAVGLEILNMLPAKFHPPCGFHAVTGHPCPTCGATRAAELIIHLKPLQALEMNPLFALVFFSLALWVLTGALARLFGRRFSIDIPQKYHRWCFILLFIAFLVNWAYMWMAGV